MTRRWWTSCALTVATSGTLVLAQQPQFQQPVFRAGVDLVQVDVVVLDQDGLPVHGLTRDDFTLLDRGMPQPIATFADLTHGHPPALLFPAGVPLDVASNQTAQSDRLVMLVLDDLHFRGRTAQAVALVRQVVSELDAGASIGVVTTSGTFGVEITEDRERLLLALKAFFDRFDPHRAEMQKVTGANAMGDPIHDPGPPDLPSFFGEFHAYKTVEDVARMMGANDGRRKAMVWISAGVEDASMAGLALHTPSVGLDPCWAKAWSCGALAGMLDRLRQSSVTVYPVDPGGPKDSGRSLDQIAAETGGFSVAANDLEAGMARLLTDLDNYYLLGFYPDDSKDKHYRPIEVRVNHPGYTVRYRRGYQPGGPPAPPKNDTAIKRLVAPVMPTTDLPLRLGAVSLLDKGSRMQVLATLEIGAQTMATLAGDQGLTDTVEFAVFAVDLKKKKVTGSDARRIDVVWPAGESQAAGSFRVQSVLSLPPGAYQLRASATSKALEKSGSVYLQIDVRAVANDLLTLSGLAVAPTRADRTAPSVLHSASLQGVALPFAPALTRVFSAGDRIRIFAQVRRQTGLKVDGTAALVGDDGTERSRVPWTLAPDGPAFIDLEMPLGDVPAGPYRLVVTATDGSRQSVREAAIRIE